MIKELHRILSGKIIADINKKYYVLYPISHEKKYLIEKRCEELLEEYLQNPNIMSQNDLKFKALLFRLGLPPNYKDMMEKLSKDLEEKKIEVISAELTRIPANTVELPEDQANEVLKLVDNLEQDDDVQKVYHNLK